MNTSAKLPPELLTRVLQHVDLKARLCSCALVSRAWQAAAAAATTSITCLGDSDMEADMASVHGRDLGNIFTWVHTHGQHVSKLCLTGDCTRPGLIQLPCCELRDLDVSGFTVQLASGDSCSSSNEQGLQLLTAFQGLTNLSLAGCTVAGSLGLEPLASVTSLQRLALNRLHLHGGSDDIDDYIALPGSVLSSLVQLTYLDMDVGRQHEDLQHFSCLSGLKALQLWHIDHHVAEALSALQSLQQLTSLGLTTCFVVDAETPSIGVSWLSNLTALRHLELDGGLTLELAFLARMTQLQDLEICEYLEGGAKGVAALLAVLPSLQQLQHLSLPDVLDCCTPASLRQGPAPAASAYSGLTASSQLLWLDLSYCRLPAAAWQHMLAARTLPRLQNLFIHGMRLRLDDTDGSGRPLTGRHLECLPQCCPHLQRLGVGGGNQCGVQFSVLMQLSALTGLIIYNVDDTTAAGLAQLTGLRALDIYTDWASATCHWNLSGAGVLQLTALSLLTRLDLTYASCRDKELCRKFVNKAPAGQFPDVSLQLSRVCQGVSSCQEALRLQMQQQTQACCDRTRSGLQQKEAVPD